MTRDQIRQRLDSICQKIDTWRKESKKRRQQLREEAQRERKDLRTEIQGLREKVGNLRERQPGDQELQTVGDCREKRQTLKEGLVARISANRIWIYALASALALVAGWFFWSNASGSGDRAMLHRPGATRYTHLVRKGGL